MSDAIPVVLFLCLAAVFTLVPVLGPHRARRRCRETARGLREDYRFQPIPQARPLPELSSLPPFHYGRRQQVLDQLTGTFAGLPGELITPGLARTLLAAPETCDWRVEGGLLVVWRRDGWGSGAALVGCCLAAVHTLAPVLDLDPDQFGAPRSAPGPEGG